MISHKLIAKTFAGLENVLAEEIRNLGGEDIEIGNRTVYYQGDDTLIYRSNYFLRTALRILKEVDSFKFKNVDHFYNKIRHINWGIFFSNNQTFMVNSTVANSRDFNNSMFASLKTKDAIVDYFRVATDKRPDIDTQNPDVIVHIHINQNRCSVSLDSSGESLHKRGYRIAHGEASLNEVLAAGMILMSGWKGNSDFVDPMCGSGTLPIEAALIARNIPPGKYRKTFAFQNWKDYNQELFEQIKSDYELKEFKHYIYASDISSKAVGIAQNNARRAMVFKLIDFSTSNFKDLQPELNDATLIFNPPYGERLKVISMDELYQMIGERLKHQYAGNTAWILSGALDSIKHIGLRPSTKKELYNGALQCKYLEYQLFKGRRAERKK